MLRDAGNAYESLQALYENSLSMGNLGVVLMKNMRMELRSTTQERARSWCWGQFCESRNLDETMEDLRKGVELLEQPFKDVILVRACGR